MWILGIAIGGYIVGVVYYLSRLMLTPPHYLHRLPSQGLGKRGSVIIDPIWGEFIHDPKTDYNLDFEEVEFPSDPNQKVIPTLRGWHIPSKREGKEKIGVITVHGGGRDRREFHRFEPFIHNAGYHMLLFDYREHGISDGKGKGLDWGHSSYHDVLGAALYAKETLKWDKVILLGVSNGAVLSILAAAHDSKKLIDGLIAESPYMSLRDAIGDIMELSMEQWPRGLRYISMVHFLIPVVAGAVALRVGGVKVSSTCIVMVDRIAPRPVFLIHGTADNRFRTRHTRDLFNRLTHEAKEIWLVEGGKHTEVYDCCPEEYQKRVLSFISRYFPFTHDKTD